MNFLNRHRLTKTLNVGSNAAYLVAAAAAWPDHFLAIAFVVLGVGSTAYHLRPEPWSKTFDRAGMYLVLSAVVATGPWTLLVWAGVLVTLFWLEVDTETFAGLAIPLALAQRLAAGHYVVLLALPVLALGYWLWHKDDGDWWGRQNPAYHSMWHVLSAIGIVILGQRP